MVNLNAWLTKRTTVIVSIIRHQAFHMEIFNERVFTVSDAKKKQIWMSSKD